MNYILSIFFGYHDSCVTFSDGNKIILHLEAERVFRIKHTRLTQAKMDELIEIGLNELNINISLVNKVYLSAWNNQYQDGKIEISGKQFTPIITAHHENHIGSLNIDTNDCLIVCADGGSEDGTTKIYLKEKNSYKLLTDLDSEIVTGKFYGTITQMIIDPRMGRAHDTYPGKTMGLAALGEYSKKYENLIYKYKDEINSLNIYGVDHLLDIFEISKNYTEPWKDKKRCDLAFTAQKIWEDEFLQFIEKYKGLSKNIGITGGCALNVSLNSRILETGWFDKIFLTPCPNDSGQSLGAILYSEPNTKCNYPFLGRGTNSFEINEKVLNMVLKDLTDEKIICWYQNRSEIGPRALGNRSLLGLPNSMEMKTKISEFIKERESYRPVAPIVLEEDVSNYFDIVSTSEYMSFSPKAKNITKRLCPAIIHLDGTSRVQTVSKEMNPNIYKILLKLKKIGLPPIIMNTSFNSNGEPIVDTEIDAKRNFENSKAEVLYINGIRYEK